MRACIRMRLVRASGRGYFAYDPGVDELLDAVRAAYETETDEAWSALYGAKVPLVYGDAASVEAAMLAWLDDPRWEARAAAAEVLRYLVGAHEAGSGRVPVARASERACALVAAMDRENDARVRAAIVSAFVDLRADIGELLTAAFVCRFAADDDARVRLAVAGALGAGNDTDLAIDTLVALTADADARVRDGACFALGHQTRRDGEPIRQALAARLDDDDEETREEAATGLALRGDERGIARVLDALERFEADGVSERVLDTADEAPDPRYVAALETIVSERPELASAVHALEACRAARPRPTCGVPRHAGCACMRVIFR